MAKIAKPKEEEVKKQTCTICEKEKTLASINFWESESVVNSNGFLHICSDCINELFSESYKDQRGFGKDYDLNGDNIIFDDITKRITKEVCRHIDLRFSLIAYDIWKSQIEAYKEKGNGESRKKLFGVYKSKLSSTAKYNDDMSGFTYEFSDDLEYVEIKKTEADFSDKTNELKLKWGTEYPENHVIRFEEKYNFLQNNYKAKTNMHIEALLKYVRYTVLAEIATENDDEKKAKTWEELAQKAATAAKINPSQLSKADLSDGLNTIAELALAVEREVDIIPILPRFKFRPNDALDFNIWCYVNYERHLRGMPMCEYSDIYKFYDERKEDYIEQYGDPYGIFTDEPTEKNRPIIKKFITEDEVVGEEGD